MTTQTEAQRLAAWHKKAWYSVKIAEDTAAELRRLEAANAGLLVHEAVHIWQEYCDYYGESSPGREQEAYAVQSVSQELMAEFARRMGAL